jgi:glycosyltransferase involved in cell wall biosynthesis
MRSISVDVIEPTISEVFQKQEFPPKTIIGVHTREHRDTVNLIKTFYAKFPQYRWITFRDLRGLSQEEFTNAMKESFSSVWIDNISSFGTFPLESMKMGIPVIGLVPNLTPEWMNEENGIWINNQNMLVDVIADFIQNWLEDNINPKLYEEMEITINKLSTQEKFDSEVVELFTKMIDNRADSFESQLSKLQITE